MTDYVHTEEFDFWEGNKNFWQILVEFDVEEVGEWIDGVWTVYHDVKLKRAQDMDGDWLDEQDARFEYGLKKIEDWTDYVRNKLDEEYIYE